MRLTIITETDDGVVTTVEADALYFLGDVLDVMLRSIKPEFSYVASLAAEKDNGDMVFSDDTY